MKTSTFHVVSRDFNLGECHSGKRIQGRNGSYFTITELMQTVASRINECLSKYPEAKHLSVEFSSILDRDYNPCGHVGCFAINNLNDFSLIEKMRQPDWEDNPQHTPETIRIPAQDGDTKDPWSHQND